MSWTRGEYRLEEGMHALDIERVCDLLADTYWAASRTRQQIERSIAHSDCFSLFHGPRQVGFVRALSDRGVYTYLMDFVLEAQHRGSGVGTWVLGIVLAHPSFADTRFILATKDAQGFYAKAGFGPHPFPWLLRP